ncbi:hypothetical protein ACFWOG_40850 [Kitasatospora sp. NPDC058406]|uniref:hypothetical protein n=1 Tax=Kitasatospora sp. NPDC058406 TaxID=3346483 RepID=UPI00365F095C
MRTPRTAAVVSALAAAVLLAGAGTAAADAGWQTSGESTITLDTTSASGNVNTGITWSSGSQQGISFGED